MSPLICYDLRFPELFEIASERAELILVPANWPSDRREHFMTLLRARAIEDQCYIAGVYVYLLSYTGDSMIVDPFGRVLARAGEGEEADCGGAGTGISEKNTGRNFRPEQTGNRNFMKNCVAADRYFPYDSE